jgi:hypothetical protein
MARNMDWLVTAKDDGFQFRHPITYFTVTKGTTMSFSEIPFLPTLHSILQNGPKNRQMN